MKPQQVHAEVERPDKARVYVRLHFLDPNLDNPMLTAGALTLYPETWAILKPMFQAGFVYTEDVVEDDE